MDFTLKTYKRLLSSLNDAGYTFQTFAEFIEDPAERAIILRHDVDAKKFNSLRFARMQASMGIRGTYYFRMMKKSYDRVVIREMSARGHEVGYHYETMDTARGNVELAYEQFCKDLERLRKLVPVKTICMHGSPLSKYDNRSLWEHYDYRKLNIIGEPYFDIDFSRVLYLTDTGRRWDGDKVSVRDKAYAKHETRKSKHENRNSTQSSKPKTQNLSFHSTQDIINAAASNSLPNQIMLTFHPQRWTDNKLLWTKELIWQNIKNIIKRQLIRK